MFLILIDLVIGSHNIGLKEYSLIISISSILPDTLFSLLIFYLLMQFTTKGETLHRQYGSHIETYQGKDRKWWGSLH